MIKRSDSIKLTLNRKHSNLESLSKALFTNNKKFVIEKISDDLFQVKFNPLYRSFFVSPRSSAYYVKGQLTSKALNNLEPIIEINQIVISKTFLILLGIFSIILIFLLLQQGEYLGCFFILLFAFFFTLINYILNILGVATFKGALIDEINSKLKF